MAGSSTTTANSAPLSVQTDNQPNPHDFYGPQVLPGGQGVRFRLWAPSAQTVELILWEAQAQTVIPMRPEQDGWFEIVESTAKAGSQYQYRINGEIQVPDPASRFQAQDAHGPSQVVELKSLHQRTSQWQGRPWEEVVLYELHVGTFTPEGTFQGVKSKLDYLKDLGVTAIELMPVADFPGQRNWGYDGVLQFAPDSRYGTPEDLIDLIDAAHEKGLMMFLDVVYNHFGPDANYLHVFAKPFFTEHYHTPWGAALNYEGQPEVRQFFIQNALFWLNEYGFDGLRFDAVHAIYDESNTHFLDELAETVRQNTDPNRRIHLVLENDDNAARFISDTQKQRFNAQWNDDFHHAAHVIATGEVGGYYEDYALPASGKSAIEHLARCLAEGFAYQGEASHFRDGLKRGEKSAHLSPSAFVNFLQNHDQIGNRAFGDRLNQTADPKALKTLIGCLLLAPSIPMLYMGQEWESQTPFQFFCDFEGELSRLVTEGRRKEFAKFPEFAKPENRERIPDPAAESTFLNSRLDWSELTQPKHAEWLAFYRQLLRLRQQVTIPFLTQAAKQVSKQPSVSSHYEVFETCGIQVQWRLASGACLQLTANLGSQPLTAPSGILDNLSVDRLRAIDCDGLASPEALQAGKLPAWSIVWQAG